TAVLGIFIAIAALPAGWVIDRIGLASTFRWSAAALAAGAVAVALVATPALLLAARLAEPLGYPRLRIGLPAILNTISPPPWRGPVLAIWSGFVPLGFATTDLLAAFMLPASAPQSFLLVIALCFVLAAASAIVSLPPLPSATPSAELGVF